MIGLQDGCVPTMPALGAWRREDGRAQKKNSMENQTGRGLALSVLRNPMRSPFPTVSASFCSAVWVGMRNGGFRGSKVTAAAM